MRPGTGEATEQAAGDVMVSPVVTVAPTASYAEIIGLLDEHGISALPVVDEWDRLAGIVTEHDLLHKATPPSPDHTAGRLMSSPVHTVEREASLAAAAQLMRDRHIKRLPVVEAGRLVGILSRGDLLRAFLSDERARAALLDRFLGVEPVGDSGAGGDVSGPEGPPGRRTRGSSAVLDVLIALIEEQRPLLP